MDRQMIMIASMLPIRVLPTGAIRNPTVRTQLAIIGAGLAGSAACGTGGLARRQGSVDRAQCDWWRQSGHRLGDAIENADSHVADVDADMRDAQNHGASVPHDAEYRLRGGNAGGCGAIRARLSRDDSAWRPRQGGRRDVYFGKALDYVTSDTPTVDGQTLGFRKALIATGRSRTSPLHSGPRGSRLSDRRQRLSSSTSCRVVSRLIWRWATRLRAGRVTFWPPSAHKRTIVQKKPLFPVRKNAGYGADPGSSAFARDSHHGRGLGHDGAGCARGRPARSSPDLDRSDDYRKHGSLVDAILTGAGRTHECREGPESGGGGIDRDAGGRIRVDDFRAPVTHI